MDLHRLDSTDGPFQLYLRAQPSPGETHIFKKVDSVNQVTINLNGAMLEGSTANVVLTNAYEKLAIVWDGAEYVRV